MRINELVYGYNLFYCQDYQVSGSKMIILKQGSRIDPEFLFFLDK